MLSSIAPLLGKKPHILACASLLAISCCSNSISSITSSGALFIVLTSPIAAGTLLNVPEFSSSTEGTLINVPESSSSTEGTLINVPESSASTVGAVINVPESPSSTEGT